MSILRNILLSESWASTKYDPSKLDYNKIHILEKRMDLIKKLDEWALVPDKRLVPYLIELGKIIDSLYKINIAIPIYRGFSPKVNFQNCMGLCEKNIFGNRKLRSEVKIGYAFDYICDNPVSFTLDINIAKDFGSCVVQTMLPKKNRLIVTDELSYLINKLRNRNNNETQKEVIILNNQIIRCKVVKV